LAGAPRAEPGVVERSPFSGRRIRGLKARQREAGCPHSPRGWPRPAFAGMAAGRPPAGTVIGGVD